MNRIPKMSTLTAAVVGGANGIGREIASQLAAAGAKVAIGDYDGDAARHTAEVLDGTVIGLDLDVTDPDSFERFLGEIETRWGVIDVLINSAGVMWVGPYADESEASTLRQVSVNLVGAIHAIKATAPRMRKRHSGHIITIASAASLLPTPGEATYSASKHGILGYLKAVRVEMRGSGVNLSVVMPTVVDTALAAGTATGAAKLLTPADVARAVMGLIGRRQFELTLPAYVGVLHRVINVLPRPLRDAVFRRLVPDQVRSVKREERAAYEANFNEPRQSDATGKNNKE